MNEKEYQEKIDSLAKQKKELQKGIELIDTEKSILTIKYLYKSRKKFSGRYFKVDDAQSNWFVYYKVLKYTQDNKFLVERFQLKSIKFELEKTIIPIDLLNEKLVAVDNAIRSMFGPLKEFGSLFVTALTNPLELLIKFPETIVPSPIFKLTKPNSLVVSLKVSVYTEEPVVVYCNKLS